MATLHQATLTPSKLELLSSWVPEQPWWPHDSACAIDLSVDYRFDDPDGEVGIQTYLLRTELGTVVQVPVTYRDAPLDVAEEHLIGTSMHSVLGKRWLYDGCADPVCVRAFATAILTGGSQAVLEILTPQGPQVREPSAVVRGTGDEELAPVAPSSPAYDNGDNRADIRWADLRLEIGRCVLAPGRALDGDFFLEGTWPGQPEPVRLAGIKRS
ncbi:MAG TPA: hypothetical protein VFN61_11110 [Acidimicrobiales bacterium]|nr:hypothetical protein [Acidimicrobiales bacterium]